MSVRLGVRIHREQPPELVLSYAQAVESLGFDEVWVVEDLTFAGGRPHRDTEPRRTASGSGGGGVMPALLVVLVLTGRGWEPVHHCPTRSLRAARNAAIRSLAQV